MIVVEDPTRSFKRNPQTKPETVTNAQGEEIERLRNTTRYAIVPPQAIGFNDPTPTRPPEGVKEGTGTEETLIKRLKEVRLALLFGLRRP